MQPPGDSDAVRKPASGSAPDSERGGGGATGGSGSGPMVLTGAMSELYSREARPRLDARLWLACRLELAQSLAEELNIGDIPRRDCLN